MKASVNKVVSKVISSKVVLATLLVLTAVTVGWVVYSGTLATIKGEVLAPEAEVAKAHVYLGVIRAGDTFRAVTHPADLGAIAIGCVKELKAKIYVEGLDDNEKKALKECKATIIIVGEKYIPVILDVINTTIEGSMEEINITEIVYHPSIEVEYIGVLDCLSDEVLETPPLPEGIYKVFVQVDGVAGYPREATPIDFDIMIQLVTPEE